MEERYAIEDHVQFPLYYDTTAKLHLPPRLQKINGSIFKVGYETTRRIDQEEFIVLILAVYYAINIGKNPMVMNVLVARYARRKDMGFCKQLAETSRKRTHNYWVFDLKNCRTEIDRIKIFKHYVTSHPATTCTEYITEIKIAHCKTKVYIMNRVSVTTNETFKVSSYLGNIWEERNLRSEVCPCRLRINGCNNCAFGNGFISNFAVTWPVENDDFLSVSDQEDEEDQEDQPKNYKKPKITHPTITNLYQENLLDPQLAALIVTTNNGIKTRNKFHSKQ